MRLYYSSHAWQCQLDRQKLNKTQRRYFRNDVSRKTGTQGKSLSLNWTASSKSWLKSCFYLWEIQASRNLFFSILNDALFDMMTIGNQKLSPLELSSFFFIWLHSNTNKSSSRYTQRHWTEKVSLIRTKHSFGHWERRNYGRSRLRSLPLITLKRTS